jgi:spermidine/putrescine ABC transporter ATP-binding subunit
MPIERRGPSDGTRKWSGANGGRGGELDVTPHLELREVSKAYGAVPAVDGISLTINPGERMALLGPSGCGKTTTLNLVAGFLQADRGEVRISGRNVAGVPAHRRNIGIVFQSYALFLHLTVADNVAFGLKLRGVGREELRRRVADALSLVRLHGLADRYPRQLSGGQQQRVALARALVIRPDILLLDEPLSNLDAKLRQEMRMELIGILKEVGITTIFVTHDQEEALALSDRVAVMNQGRVEQVGSPEEVYEDPATPFVAKFLGETNILAGRVARSDEQGVVCDIGGALVHSNRKALASPGDAVEVIVRAERLSLSHAPSGLANCVPAEIEHVMYLGSDIRFVVKFGEHRITALQKNRGDGSVPRPGDRIYLEWPARESFVAPLA